MLPAGFDLSLVAFKPPGLLRGRKLGPEVLFELMRQAFEAAELRRFPGGGAVACHAGHAVNVAGHGGE